ANLDRADARIIHVDVIVGEHPSPLQRLRQPLRFPQLSDERHTDEPRTGAHRDAELQTGVAANLHVLLPLGSARKSRLTVACITGGSGPSRSAAADGEAFQQLAVQSNLELLGPAHA